jgi:hypothetical protein
MKRRTYTAVSLTYYAAYFWLFQTCQNTNNEFKATTIAWKNKAEACYDVVEACEKENEKAFQDVENSLVNVNTNLKGVERCPRFKCSKAI